MGRTSAEYAGVAACIVLIIAQASGQADLTTQSTAAVPSHAPAAAPTSAANAVKITPNATSFSNNDVVVVSFSGIQKPTNNDAIGLFFAGASADQVLPLKYFWVRTSPRYLQTGSGSVTFVLANQRKNVQFQFFRNATANNGFSNLTYSGTSPVVTLATPNQPLHVHLAPINSTAVLAQWTTRDAGSPMVMFGTTSGQYTMNVTGTTHTYNASTFCGGPANSTGYVDPGSLHNATMAGLLPNTEYFYKVGDPTYGFSQEFNFFTPPPVGNTSTVHFLAIADLGHTTLDGADEYDYDISDDPMNFDPTGTLIRSYDTITQIIYDNEFQQGASRDTVNHLAADKSQNWTLFLLNGDVSYARGMETMWDLYMDYMQKIGAYVPWALTNGNHERDYPASGDRYNGAEDSGGECNVAYANRFQMPINHSESYEDFSGRVHPVEWYSYDHGPIHFTTFSTEIDFSPGSAQYEWMVNDFKNVNRSITPWLVVNGHRPIYTTSSSGGSLTSVTGVAEDLRAALENVFYQYEVDITYWGHDHIYERTCAGVFRQICQPRNADGSASAPMHVVIGNAGYELSWFANPNVPPYWDVIFVEHGYMRCTVNSTSYYCEEISSVSGDLLDAWRLTKPAGWKPMGPTKRKTEIALFDTPYLSTNLIELYGIPGANYSVFEAQPYAELLGANVTLTEQLNNMTQAVQDAVNGAAYGGGIADTMVDVWDVLRPFYQLLTQTAATNASVASSAQGFIELLQQVEKVANVYGTQNGLWYESSRAQQGQFPTVRVGGNTQASTAPAAAVAANAGR